MVSSASNPVAIQCRCQRESAHRLRAEHLLQILADPQIVHRMDVAGDGIGDLAHARAAERIARQQRRLGHDLVEIFA